MEQKPLVKSFTFWLGLAVAVLPAVIQFVQAGKFDAASVLSFVLGALIIVRRILADPAGISGLF